MTRSMVDTFGGVFSFIKGGNSAFIAAIASGLFPQTGYRSLGPNDPNRNKMGSNY